MINERSYDHILIDTNNTFCANHYAFSNLSYKVKNSIIQTGGIYGSVLAFQRLRKRFLKEDGTMWALFDNAKSMVNVRKTIDPEYKLNRTKMPKSFYRSLDYFRLIQLSYSNSEYVVYETGYEADDIAPVIIRKIPTDKKILVVSEDLDWSRLIGYQGRTVHQYMKKMVFDQSKFNEHYGFLPTVDKIVLYKIIRGDKVDNIPKGIKGLPTKALMQLIDDYKNIFEIKENLEIIPYLSEHWKEVITKNFSRLTLNHQLVSFLSLSDKDINQFIFKCKYQPKVLKILYESLGFNIEKIDERIYSTRRKKKTGNSFDDFWHHPTIPRKK